MSEFGHSLNLDQIRDGDRLDIVADEAERKAVADRLGLQSIDGLEAHVVLSRDGTRIKATGRLKSSLEQNCVATGDPVPAHIDEPFDLMFLPEPKGAGTDEEVELGETDLDTIFHDGSAIDLGGATTDPLARALDP